MAQHDPREPADPATATNDVQTDELPSQTGGNAGPRADPGRDGLGAGRDDDSRPS